MSGPANLPDYGDNLKVLRTHVKDESVDLVYLRLLEDLRKTPEAPEEKHVRS